MRLGAPQCCPQSDGNTPHRLTRGVDFSSTSSRAAAPAKRPSSQAVAALFLILSAHLPGLAYRIASWVNLPTPTYGHTVLYQCLSANTCNRRSRHAAVCRCAASRARHHLYCRPWLHSLGAAHSSMPCHHEARAALHGASSTLVHWQGNGIQLVLLCSVTNASPNVLHWRGCSTRHKAQVTASKRAAGADQAHHQKRMPAHRYDRPRRAWMEAVGGDVVCGCRRQARHGPRPRGDNGTARGPVEGLHSTTHRVRAACSLCVARTAERWQRGPAALACLPPPEKCSCRAARGPVQHGARQRRPATMRACAGPSIAGDSSEGCSNAPLSRHPAPVIAVMEYRHYCRTHPRD
jgi:hypothetical protein